MAYYFVRGSRPQNLQLLWIKEADKMTLLVSQSTWNGQSHLVEDRYETGLGGTF